MAPLFISELHDRPAADGSVLRALGVGVFVCFWCVLWGMWATLFGCLRCAGLARFGFHVWARGILHAAGVRVEVTRRAALENEKPYVFMSNHQSALDIPILFAALMPAHDLRFMAKESLFKIPIFGWGMWATGFIPIRRDSARHSAELLQELTKAPRPQPLSLSQEEGGGQPQPKSALKFSYVVFPEGTRSPDGRLQPLKRGAVGLALRLGLPVAPVTIVDAARANPKGRFRLSGGTVRVVVHEAIGIETGAAGRAQRDEMIARIHAAIDSALPEDQRAGVGA